ncbi:MAG: NAD(P)H-dependent glycerol-3-phosphate dehydrogenase [Burkholderiaceae bacterium]
MRISVMGAGAWGTALAIAATRHRHRVLLWARDAGQAQRMAADRRNARYLPSAAWPDELAVTADHSAAVDHARGGLVIVATPMASLRERLAALPHDACVLWLCKGIESASGSLGHQIAAAVLPKASVGVLSGPSFAQEVAGGSPAALVAASADAALCELAVKALHGDSIRIYRSSDVIGVEVGGAVKNVLAIATGIADGLQLGLNARAALITRGLAEMTRLGVALGASPETFTGLSGLGDLVLTATGDLSRNRRVGLMLAQGLALPDALERLGHVAEGVHCAETVARLAHEHGVTMPIADAVSSVIHRRMNPRDAVLALMRRGARQEG